jgi:hypothetical protein
MIRLVATVCARDGHVSLCHANTGVHVGETYLDSGRENTGKGEQEAHVGEGVFANGGEGGAEHDGHQGEVGDGIVGAGVDNAINENREDGDGGAKHLVEGNRDHGPATVSYVSRVRGIVGVHVQGQVGHGNVNGEKQAEGEQDEVLPPAEARHGEVVHLQEAVAADGRA